MAKAPSTKPYRAISVANGEDGDFSDDHRPGYSEECGQVADGDGGIDYDDGGGVEIIATRPTHRFRRLVSSACLLLALAFGCRVAYVKFFGEGSSSGVAVDDTNANGYFFDGDGRDKEDDFVNEAGGFDDDASANEDGLVLDLVEGDNDDDDGDEIFEEYLDDEIKNHEVGGEFDYDMDYDDQGEEVDYENGDDLGEEEGGSDYENEDDFADENGDVYAHDGEEEQGEGEEEGVEDIGEGLTFEIEDVDENHLSEPLEDEDEAPSDEDLVEGDTIVDEEEEGLTEDEIIADEKDKDPDMNEITPEGELPDYFVPLTPAERTILKERLRSTLRATESALLISAKSDSFGSINPSPQRTLVLNSDSPKQFMHMHHMKTGGTSLDGLIRCALQRQKDVHGGTTIKYNSMSECGSMVRVCMEDLAGKLNASVADNIFYQNDAQGQPQVETQFSFDPADESLDIPVDELNVCSTSDANVMSYCASLHTVRTFGWKGVDKITVIRDPVDRAWSMYRFTLDRCYKCQELKDVLRRVENGTFKGENPNFVYSPNDNCAVQMIGHQATNLLSSVDLYNVANDVRFPSEKEIVEEAVRNLREEFTWIGLTDRLDESVRAFRDVFPFLAENLSETVASLHDLFEKSGEQVDGSRFSLPEGYSDDKGCPFPHSNGGREPHCGTKELDDETIYWIKKLNNRDVAVYKAAVERFNAQMEVLGEYRSGSL